MRTHPTYTNPKRGFTGFTMVELLTVIGIIVILMAILMPVVSKIRTQAQVTSTQNQINQIAGAVEQYKTETGFYPGPLPNSAFTPTVTVGGADGRVTTTENLTLALCGGLKATGTSTTATYDWQKVGSGAAQFVPVVSKRTPLRAFLDPTPGSMVPVKGATGWGENGKTGNPDSDIPEFMDRFSDSRPILYMRANTGAPNVIPGFPGGGLAQYDPAWLGPYMTHAKEGYGGNNPDLTKDFPTRNGATAGLQSYFVHPNVANSPKGKDGFLLISAGADGRFFTKDDLTNVGAP